MSMARFATVSAIHPYPQTTQPPLWWSLSCFPECIYIPSAPALPLGSLTSYVRNLDPQPPSRWYPLDGVASPHELPILCLHTQGLGRTTSHILTTLDKRQRRFRGGTMCLQVFGARQVGGIAPTA